MELLNLIVDDEVEPPTQHSSLAADAVCHARAIEVDRTVLAVDWDWQVVSAIMYDAKPSERNGMTLSALARNWRRGWLAYTPDWAAKRY